MHTQITEKRRLLHTDRLFGVAFPLRIEPMIYTFADQLSSDYHGGYWHFYELSNGGFYMAPSDPVSFRVSAENGYEGRLSADAFGITCCLYTYSALSFQAVPEVAEHYHLLRDHARQHQEVAEIFAAID